MKKLIQNTAAASAALLVAGATNVALAADSVSEGQLGSGLDFRALTFNP